MASVVKTPARKHTFRKVIHTGFRVTRFHSSAGPSSEDLKKDAASAFEAAANTIAARAGVRQGVAHDAHPIHKKNTQKVNSRLEET